MNQRLGVVEREEEEEEEEEELHQPKGRRGQVVDQGMEAAVMEEPAAARVDPTVHRARPSRHVLVQARRGGG
jgi:hypothetical protein